MQLDDPIYKIMADIWETTHKLPRPHEYRGKTRRTTLPTFDDLVQQFGTFDNAVIEFIDAYYAIHGYAYIDDYLLGALVSNAVLIWPKNNRSRWFLRFITNDEPQIKILESFPLMKKSARTKFKVDRPSSIYLRCYDDDLIIAYDHLCKTNQLFRPTIDFIRGYIDTHSHFRKTSSTAFRLTITGPLVPQIHDFLLDFGAANTSVHIAYETKHKESYRMNLHMKSLRKIRDVLYPDGCLCNEKIRLRIYQA